jgi:4-hydroxybenzoate polyprenyltransferase
LELVRFSHTIFALPFALLSAAMAWSRRYASYSFRVVLESGAYGGGEEAIKQLEPWFRWRELLGIVLCMVFARSAAMAFNRLVDAKFDADNPRTARRHIPAGLLTRDRVASFAIGCALAFMASTLLFVPNDLPFMLSVPVLIFICAYSLTKRFTLLAHFWLGASLMLAPVAAWIAILGYEGIFLPGVNGHNVLMLLPPLILGGAVLFWVAGFDIIYATQDVDIDRKLRLRSVPARFGIAGALRIAAVCHAGMVLLLFLLPHVFPGFGLIWNIGVAATTLLLIYEHAIVTPDDLTRVNDAFFNCNAVISLGLFAIGVVDLWI